MTEVVAIPVHENKVAGRAEYDRLRSRIIDLFAMLEAAVDAELIKRGVKKTTSPLGQRLTKLATLIAADTKVPQARKKRVEKWFTDVASVIAIRNDLIHSPMELKQIDELTHAVFRSWLSLDMEHPVYRIITIEEMRSINRKLGTLRTQVGQLLG